MDITKGCMSRTGEVGEGGSGWGKREVVGIEAAWAAETRDNRVDRGKRPCSHRPNLNSRDVPRFNKVLRRQGGIGKEEAMIAVEG